MSTTKQPAVFVAHGAGPLPILNHSSHIGLTKWLQQFSSHLKGNPKSILVISAHWEVRSCTRHDGVSIMPRYSHLAVQLTVVLFICRRSSQH